MSSISAAWMCSACGDWHDDEDAAIDCCRPTFAEGWKCDACGEYHRLKANAENCCGHQCRECGEYSDDAGTVCEHCGHDTANDPLSPATLEAHGQQRLLP